MSLTFLPKTKLGKISAGSFVMFIVTWTLEIVLLPLLMSSSNLSSGAGHPALADIVLIVLTIAGMIAVFVGFVTRIMALFSKKDHSVLLIIIILLCLLIGFGMVLFLSGA